MITPLQSNVLPHVYLIYHIYILFDIHFLKLFIYLVHLVVKIFYCVKYYCFHNYYFLRWLLLRSTCCLDCYYLINLSTCLLASWLLSLITLWDIGFLFDWIESYLFDSFLLLLLLIILFYVLWGLALSSNPRCYLSCSNCSALR